MGGHSLGQWHLEPAGGGRSADVSSALGKIIHNACKFTDSGYVHITVQDDSRVAVLPAGYNNSIKLSTIMIDIKDSGRGSGSYASPLPVAPMRLPTSVCRVP
jgi:hypothetical protein